MNTVEVTVTTSDGNTTRIIVPAGATVNLVPSFATPPPALTTLAPSISDLITAHDTVRWLVQHPEKWDDEPDLENRVRLGLPLGKYRGYRSQWTGLVATKPMVKMELPLLPSDPLLSGGFGTWLDAHAIGFETHNGDVLPQWQAWDGRNFFSHFAMAFDQPQDYETLIGHLAYVAAPLGLKDQTFQPVCVLSDTQGVRLVVMEWDTTESHRSDFLSEADAYLIPYLKNGTPVRKRGAQNGTKAFEPIQGNFAIVFNYITDY